MIVKMKDICTKIGSGATARGGKDAYIDEGISLIRSQNILDFSFSHDGLTYINEEQARKLNGVTVEVDDVLLNITGDSVARVCIVDNDILPARVNQHVCILRGDKGKVLSSFILYFLQMKKQELLQMASGGATRNALTKGMIEELEIDLPSIEEQKKIVSMLDSIQEKLKTNNKINRNLEEQAQSIFQEWFINGSRYEKDANGNFIGVSDVSLAELMDYAGGSQPPASEFRNEKLDGYIRFVQIRDYETDAHITYIPVSSKNKLCDEYDIMIARYGASLGRICFGLDGAYNVALAKVFPKKPYYREFLRSFLSSKDFYEGLNSRGGRSAQSGFNQSDIKSFRLLFPDDDSLIKEYEELVHPLISARLKLKKENVKLAEVRDALLPKLMSGELDVSDLDI